MSEINRINNEDIEASFSAILNDMKKSANRQSTEFNIDSQDNSFEDMKAAYDDGKPDESDFSKYFESDENHDVSNTIETKPVSDSEIESDAISEVTNPDIDNDYDNIADTIEEIIKSEGNVQTSQPENFYAFSDLFDGDDFVVKPNHDSEQQSVDNNCEDYNVIENTELISEESEDKNITNIPLQPETHKETLPVTEQKRSTNENIKKDSKDKAPLDAGQLAYKIATIVFMFIAVCCAIYLLYKFVISAAITKYFSNSLSDKRITETNEDILNKRFLEIQAKYPDVVFPEGMIPSLWVPYAENQDTIGWITIDGLGIDYPVVQTDDKDNNSYYLRRDFYTKKYSIAGTIFLSSNDKINPLSKNMVIYGHHMQNGTMFGQLKKYKSIDVYKNNPIIKFDTLYEENYWKIYAVMLVNADPADDNNYVFGYTVTDFSSDENFAGFINEIDQRKLYSTGIDINKNDTLLTLQTCDHDFDDARLIVVARKMRVGEDTKIDTSMAKTKAEKDIRYPQAWYDKHHKTNPYKDAPRWNP